MTKVPLLLAILALSALHSAFAQPAAAEEMPVTELYPLLVRFEADRGSLSRFYFIDNSPERRKRFKSFYEGYLAELKEQPFEALSKGGQVEYLVFKQLLEDALYRLSVEEEEFGELKEWVSYGAPIYELEKQRRRGKHMDGQAVARQFHSLQEAVQANIRKLEQAPGFPANLARRAAGIVEGHSEALNSVYDFYQGYAPRFSWWVKEPCKKLDTTLLHYAKLLREKVDSTTLPPDDGSGIIGRPIGRQELIRLLASEMIPYSPEELVDIANEEFAWCDAELLKASREMGFGDDWRKAQEQVKQAYVPPGHQPEAMLELYEQSVAFLKDHDLISIPPLAEETWRMSMIPPERQLISPFFLGGEVLQISYPTDEMAHEDKLMSMRGNNPHFSRATVHHELIAGHHLQMFMNDRHKPYRRIFRTPFWIEGWALYWEMILWDQGFPRSPEDRIGMLFWRMHRCARIIFSLNYHQGKWTPQQCIDFLVERVGHERANAEGEVRRSFTGNYGPLYQLAYMTGGLQFYALKKELVDSGRMSYRQFHDAVMRENYLPVEMIRALLTDQPLAEDLESSWRFYEE